MGLPEFPNQNFDANQSRGSRVMIGQTNKQTDIKTEITTLYMYINTIQYTYSACIDAKLNLSNLEKYYEMHISMFQEIILLCQLNIFKFFN